MSTTHQLVLAGPIGKGNFTTPEMRGHLVRAATDTRHWKPRQEYPTGYLRDFDLQGFTDLVNLPNHVRKFILAETADKPIWMYVFFHIRGSANYSNKLNATVHGWILT